VNIRSLKLLLSLIIITSMHNFLHPQGKSRHFNFSKKIEMSLQMLGSRASSACSKFKHLISKYTIPYTAAACSGLKRFTRNSAIPFVQNVATETRKIIGNSLLPSIIARAQKAKKIIKNCLTNIFRHTSKNILPDTKKEIKELPPNIENALIEEETINPEPSAPPLETCETCKKEMYHEVVLSPCGHLICGDCAYKEFVTSQHVKCPFCNAHVTEIIPSSEYNLLQVSENIGEKENEKIEECCICFEALEEKDRIKLTPCGHDTFCKSCIQENIKDFKRKTCPICNKNIDTETKKLF